MSFSTVLWGILKLHKTPSKFVSEGLRSLLCILMTLSITFSGAGALGQSTDSERPSPDFTSRVGSESAPEYRVGPIEISSEQGLVAQTFQESLLVDPALRFQNAYAIRIEFNGGPSYSLDPQQYQLNRLHVEPDLMQSFLQNRETILKGLARVLSFGRLGFGVGSLVKNKVKQMVGRGGDTHPIEELTGESVRNGIGERGRVAVEGILRSVDTKLWQESRRVAEANEFGAMASVGTIAEGGARSKGVGGSFSIGISFAYNVKQKALVFDIYRQTERFQKSLAAVGLVGVLPKVGFFLAGTPEGAAHRPRSGYSFYPPGAPGYMEVTNSHYSAGFSTSLSLPPPPIVDLFTYTNSTHRVSMLRITISPILPGFVRVSIGGLPEGVSWALQKTENLLQEIAAQSRRLVTYVRCRIQMLTW